MFRQTIEAYGTLHILVNNASLQRDAAFHEMTLDNGEYVLAVNLTGQFPCSREAVNEFLRHGPAPEASCSTGKIICVSSVHDVIP